MQSLKLKSLQLVTGFGILLLTVLSFVQPAAAGTNAGTAGAFLRMGLGARALAMGDVGVAIPGNGFGIYYNPAALPYLKQMTALSTYNYLSLDRHLNFIGFAAPLHPPAGIPGKTLSAGMGVGWINAGSGDMEARDPDGKPLGTFSNSENAFYFSFALCVTEKLALGISPKVLYNYFPDLTSGESLKSTRLGFDAGILFNPIERLYLGAQARHINAQYRWDTSTLWGSDGTVRTEKFPRIYRLGAAYQTDFGLLVTGEFETSDQNDNQIHAGAEYLIIAPSENSFALRAGYDDEDLAFGIGYGFALWKVRGQFDYAYQIQQIPPFDSQVISFSVSF